MVGAMAAYISFSQIMHFMVWPLTQDVHQLLSIRHFSNALVTSPLEPEDRFGCRAILPAPGAMQQFYVLLPYAGALVAGISAVWALARMSRGGARLRSYVYEETVAKLPLRCLLTGVFAALAAVGECMDVFLNGGQGAIRYAVLFTALAAAAAAAAFAAGHTIRAAVYTEEADSGREE